MLGFQVGFGSGISLFERRRVLAGQVHRLWRGSRSLAVTASRRPSVSVSCRLRNPGGFHLPPRVPNEEHELRRAIELLGNRTQRRLRPEMREALAALLGEYPPTKEIAQQWKYRLTRIAQEEQVRRKQSTSAPQGADPGPVTRRQALLREIEQNLLIPESDEQVQRAFSILGRIIERKDKPTESEEAELQRLLGVVPGGVLTAKRAVRVLREQVASRRRFERWPPFVPLALERVREARVILRQIAIQRSAGAKAAARLKELLAGGYPRNQRVARSWWKRFCLVERLYEKKAYKAMRKELVERIRAERRARAEKRRLQGDAPPA